MTSSREKCLSIDESTSKPMVPRLRMYLLVRDSVGANPEAEPWRGRGTSFPPVSSITAENSIFSHYCLIMEHLTIANVKIRE